MRGKSKTDAAAPYDLVEYESAVVNSALWSAAGDALGWMTELSRGASGVKHRTGADFVTEPVAWKRLIGGKFGAKVDLPAGTYSDDTQLRLSVSRSIRGDGAFDVEAFAKVEVTVWQGYCLGAGIGSKAAAANLAKRGVNWFSNFFQTDRQKYVNAGGNGAAMRIQPHVWSAKGTDGDLIAQVIRDAIVTHGHPHGFCGAIFHALCLRETIRNRKIPSLEDARSFIDRIPNVAELVARDSELSSFWLPTWENEAGKSLADALYDFRNEATRDLNSIVDLFQKARDVKYHDLLEQLGCLTERYRGSGFKTAFAALLLSQLFQDKDVEGALTAAANELESDTDTIATMAGALLGVLAKRSPEWKIQDRQYIESEATRMARIAFGKEQRSFQYPDISQWTPPSNQSESIVQFNGALALSGFGPVSPRSDAYESRGSIWQWFELGTSQTVLAKRRAKSIPRASANQFPVERRVSAPAESASRDEKAVQEGFNFDLQTQTEPAISNRSKVEHTGSTRPFPGIDRASSEIISSGFDNATLGMLLNQCIDETGSIEGAIGLASIVAKAKLARNKRR